jgi:hypothetical protein
MYVCMYVCVYIYTYIHVYVYIHISPSLGVKGLPGTLGLLVARLFGELAPGDAGMPSGVLPPEVPLADIPALSRAVVLLSLLAGAALAPVHTCHSQGVR